MSHILKGLSKRITHIPHVVLYDEDKWQKVCSNAYFGVFMAGGHFWRVTLLGPGEPGLLFEKECWWFPNMEGLHDPLLGRSPFPVAGSQGGTSQPNVHG